MSDQERSPTARKRCSDTCDCGYVGRRRDGAWYCMACGMKVFSHRTLTQRRTRTRKP